VRRGDGYNAGARNGRLTVRERQLGISGWGGLNPDVRLNIIRGELAQLATDAAILKGPISESRISTDVYRDAFDYRSLLSEGTREELRRLGK
jgi:hypothetical protein